MTRRKPAPDLIRGGDRREHGEFGRSHRDLTAIGTVVNTASRAQTIANADQILVTEAVYQRARSDLSGSQAKAYRLKGFEAPIELYAA